MLGVHINQGQDYARACGFKCYQTLLGNKQSLQRVFLDEAMEDPMWIGHASFIAHASPKKEYDTSVYLRYIIDQAKRCNLKTLVIHTGAVVGVPVKIVIERMKNFLHKYLIEYLEEKEMTLAVEFGASSCGFNLEPIYFLEAFKGTPIGYCFDLAHTYASGCMWRDIRSYVETYTPLVTHINFPGSPHGSGRDVHGWRNAPKYMKSGLRLSIRNSGIEELTQEYDTTIKFFNQLKIPMILEGSAFSISNMGEEYAKIKEILNE